MVLWAENVKEEKSRFTDELLRCIGFGEWVRLLLSVGKASNPWISDSGGGGGDDGMQWHSERQEMVISFVVMVYQILVRRADCKNSSQV